MNRGGNAKFWLDKTMDFIFAKYTDMYVRQWLDNEYGKAEATPYKKLYGKDIVIMERSFIEGEIKKGIFQKQIFSDLHLDFRFLIIHGDLSLQDLKRRRLVEECG